MKRLPWIERKFEFNLPMGWLENVLVRLAGAPIRLAHYCREVDEAHAGIRVDGKWSIKEHLGHLGDLEVLHHGRMEDFELHRPTLRAADMQNRRTEAAQHNRFTTEELLQNFTIGREAMVSLFRELDSETQAFTSIHPRLQVSMKPVDMAFFIAEHDDHHIATLVELLHYWRGKG